MKQMLNKLKLKMIWMNLCKINVRFRELALVKLGVDNLGIKMPYKRVAQDAVLR